MPVVSEQISVAWHQFIALAQNAERDIVSLWIITNPSRIDCCTASRTICLRPNHSAFGCLAVFRRIDASWSVYASRGYVERNGWPDNPDELKGHLVVDCEGSNANCDIAVRQKRAKRLDFRRHEIDEGPHS